MNQQHLLLDIEGTTCPVSFVSDVLFPFAKQELSHYIKQYWDKMPHNKPIQAAKKEWLGDKSPESMQIKQQAMKGKTGVEMLPSVYGYAEGIKYGQKMSVATTFHTEESIDDLSMGEGTSYPLACGVKMLADGVINQTGVHAPESGIISPDLFFDYLSKELPGDISIKPEISKAVIS